MAINITKLQKDYPEFTDEVDKLDATALKNRIVALQEALGESEEHKEANEELKAASTSVQELLGPYRDVRKAVKAKTQYIIELLKAKD